MAKAKKVKGSRVKSKKPEAKKNPQQPNNRPVIEAGYHGYRDNKGRTPRQLLDEVKAQREFLKLKREREELVLKADVDMRDAEQAELILNDMNAFPKQVAYSLSGKARSITEVQQILEKAVQAMLQHWAEAEIMELRSP